jgi:nitroimidazol reductase NimA-like FMN-containing flavoprotein (pyridoxamine 5'-phosphate oxidase superfamily)
MTLTERIKVKRVPNRGIYDINVINAILDANFLCHIGFIHHGHPVVIPTLYGRQKDRLYIHGATSSRMLKSLQENIEVSIAVTLVDGIVLARSAFHHSINYRSVVLFGTAQLIEKEEDKIKALGVISEQVIPGRWKEIRLPNRKELKATTVLYLTINEASAKIRSGPPVDEKNDYELDIWAGVLPVQVMAKEPVTDPQLKAGIPVSRSVEDYLNRFK